MSRKEESEREERIVMEIIVDAYNPEEVAMGWYCYLEDRIQFPFAAECKMRRKTSPLKPAQRYHVKNMAHADECAHEMFVLVDYAGDELAVPLSQLQPVGELDEVSTQAREDWQYWCEMGYEF